MTASGFTVRPFEAEHLSAVDALLRGAFRTSAHFAPHVERYLRITGSELFVGSLFGRIIACGGSLAYGDVAIIGLMAVDSELGRHGFGGAMLAHIEASARARGVRTFVLDATESGRGLYARHGYAVVSPCDELVFGGVLTSGGDFDTIDAATLEALVRFDAAMTGCDRASMVRVYVGDPAHRTLVARDVYGEVSGYAVAQAALMGPFVARDHAAAEALLERALRLPYAAGPRVLVPGHAGEARAVLCAKGFVSGRVLTHMHKGAVAHAASAALYGKASFAAG
jgi:GNAT superfamily N-acetyltransferase